MIELLQRMDNKLHNGQGTLAPRNMNIVLIDNDDMGNTNFNGDGAEQADNEGDSVGSDQVRDDFCDTAVEGNDIDESADELWNKVLFVGKESVNAINDVVNDFIIGTSSMGEADVNAGNDDMCVMG